MVDVRTQPAVKIVDPTNDARSAGVDGSGNLQVIVNASLPTGPNTIGEVTLGATTFTATSLGKSEDAVHGSGDVGVMMLGVRNDDLSNKVGLEGDYASAQMTENGALLICPAANDDYQYEFIDDATTPNNTIVTSVASRKIRVLSLFMLAAGTVIARFEDGAGGAALTGQMNLVANSGFTLPYNPAGWFETSVNTLLNLELSAAISVDGSLTYILVP